MIKKIIIGIICLFYCSSQMNINALATKTQIPNLPIDLIFNIHHVLMNYDKLSNHSSYSKLIQKLDKKLLSHGKYKLRSDFPIEYDENQFKFWVEQDGYLICLIYKNNNGVPDFQYYYKDKWYPYLYDRNLYLDHQVRHTFWGKYLFYAIVVLPVKTFFKGDRGEFKGLFLDFMKWFPLITVGAFLYKILTFLVNQMNNLQILPPYFELLNKHPEWPKRINISQTKLLYWQSNALYVLKNHEIDQVLDVSNINEVFGTSKNMMDPLINSDIWNDNELEFIDNYEIVVVHSQDPHNPFLMDDQGKHLLAYADPVTHRIYINDVFYRKTIGAIQKRINLGRNKDKLEIDLYELKRLSGILQAAIASSIAFSLNESEQRQIELEQNFSGHGEMNDHSSKLRDAFILLMYRFEYNKKMPDPIKTPQKYYRRLIIQLLDKTKSSYALWNTLKVVILEASRKSQLRSKRIAAWYIKPYVDSIRSGLHSSIPMRENPIPNYGSYLWSLHLGFSDDAAKLIAKYAIDVDSIKYGFVPILGQSARHFNMYLHVLGNFDPYHSHHGFKNSVMAIYYFNKNNLFPEYNHRDEMIRYDLSHWRFYEPTRPNTLKRYFIDEFIASLKHLMDQNLLESLKHLGFGLHSVQDMSAHQDFNPGPYATGLHPPHYDDPYYDQLGNFDETLERVGLAEKMTKAYLSRYQEYYQMKQRIRHEGSISLGEHLYSSMGLFNSEKEYIQFLYAFENPVIRHENPDIDRLILFLWMMLYKKKLTNDEKLLLNRVVEQIRNAPYYSIDYEFNPLLQIFKNNKLVSESIQHKINIEYAA